MNAATITAAVEELAAAYGDRAHVARDGHRTLVRVDGITLPAGCRPGTTDLLVVLDPAAPKPQHFVRPGQTLANGRPPKNSSTAVVGGESWMTFSYNVPYREGESLLRFVAILQNRFGHHE